MNCKEARQLISPHLDGVLAEKEILLLQRHLKGCQQCAQIYREQARLSEVLRLMGKDIRPAPPGFKELVMGAVEAESNRAMGNKLWTKWAKTWKKTVPAVAAAVFLFLASLNWIIPGGPAIVPIAIQEQEPASPPEAATPVEVVESIEAELPTPVVTEPKTEEPVQAATPDPAVKPEKPLVIAENPVEDPAVPAPSTPVLLSMGNRNILTTMLLVQTQQDQGSLTEHLYSIAAKSNGTVEKLGQEFKDGVNYNLFKITVDRTQNSALLTALSSLGTVVKKEEDHQDISQAYSQALEEFLSLSTQRGAAQDAAEIKQLEQQITKLQKQLGDWKQKASMATVVFCVQEQN